MTTNDLVSIALLAHKLANVQLFLDAMLFVEVMQPRRRMITLDYESAVSNQIICIQMADIPKEWTILRCKTNSPLNSEMVKRDVTM